MEMEYDFDLLMGYLENRDYRSLRAALAEENEVDIADFIERLPQEKATLAFRTLPKELAAEVFSNLPPETQQVIVGSITDKELSAIVEDLFVDDAVDMLEELPASVVKRVLKSAAPETRSLINQFLNYPENSVGSIMTAEFIDLRKSMTVQDAIKRIRRTGEDSELIYTCTTDDRRLLEGS
ncbi:MAG: magnesium transporter MgtE N-terminal domain-containing protein [Anaerotruncus massiliensis (ex Togo et al. 2019)]